MSVDTDRRVAWAKSDIRRAEDEHFRTKLDRDTAEAAFVRAVEAIGVASSNIVLARAELTQLEALLCSACGCFKEDHGDGDAEDPRGEGWLCYDCGRDEECPR